MNCQHYNATLYSSCWSQQLLQLIHWQLLDHPPYCWQCRSNALGWLPVPQSWTSRKGYGLLSFPENEMTLFYLKKIMKHDTYDLQYSGLALMVAWLSISCHAWSNVRPSVLSPSSAKYTISFAAACAEFARSNFTAACWVSCKACTVTWNSFTHHHSFHYSSYYYIYSNLTDFSNRNINIQGHQSTKKF